MKGIGLAAIGGLFLAAVFSAPARAANPNPIPARPGSLNYLEGDASIGMQALRANSVGSVVLQAGQTLETRSGRAELLLTLGVFLRVDDNSSVQMISAGLADTEVRLNGGRAMVEGDDIRKENNIRIDLDGASVQLLRNGLYSFDADHNQVFVIKGKATVFAGDKKYDVGDHRQILLSDKPKTKGFDASKYQDDFYRWSSLRSAYLADANVDVAHGYVASGIGWYGTGWYWNSWFGAYTFVPGAGLLYSPFGWGFYSPVMIYNYPFFYRGPYFHTFGPGYIYPYPYRPVLPAPAPGFGVVGGGFRGPVRGFHSFRGATGFHAGGFAGGHR